eukprot:PhM_4_TR4085/c0_g1_i1/m.35112
MRSAGITGPVCVFGFFSPSREPRREKESVGGREPRRLELVVVSECAVWGASRASDSTEPGTESTYGTSPDGSGSGVVVASSPSSSASSCRTSSSGYKTTGSHSSLASSKSGLSIVTGCTGSSGRTLSSDASKGRLPLRPRDAVTAVAVISTTGGLQDCIGVRVQTADVAGPPSSMSSCLRRATTSVSRATSLCRTSSSSATLVSSCSLSVVAAASVSRSCVSVSACALRQSRSSLVSAVILSLPWASSSSTPRSTSSLWRNDLLCSDDCCASFAVASPSDTFVCPCTLRARSSWAWTSPSLSAWHNRSHSTRPVVRRLCCSCTT